MRSIGIQPELAWKTAWKTQQMHNQPASHWWIVWIEPLYDDGDFPWFRYVNWASELRIGVQEINNTISLEIVKKQTY
jgi:hypothetical protein